MLRLHSAAAGMEAEVGSTEAAGADSMGVGALAGRGALVAVGPWVEADARMAAEWAAEAATLRVDIADTGDEDSAGDAARCRKAIEGQA